MKTVVHVEDLAGLVGSEVGSSPWVVIDQQRIDSFAEATDDHQWIHVDQNRAAVGPFGGTIAHGHLTLSLVPALVREAFEVSGVATRINYGLDSVRFPSPVRSGSSVRAIVSVASFVPLPDGRLRLGCRVVVENSVGDRPACVAETLTILVRA